MIRKYIQARAFLIFHRKNGVTKKNRNNNKCVRNGSYYCGYYSGKNVNIKNLMKYSTQICEEIKYVRKTNVKTS